MLRPSPAAAPQGAEDYPALTGALGPRDSISALSDSDAESSEEVSYAATTEAPSAGGAELEADLKVGVMGACPDAATACLLPLAAP